MDAGATLRQARRRRGLSQRQLAHLSAVAQPAIARIESGAVDPQVQTLDRLLRACGETLFSEPRLGEGVDRTGIRSLLELTPGERARLAVDEARNLDRVLSRRGRRHR
jgi:transcriptional regulator with XRE-family HTH domain